MWLRDSANQMHSYSSFLNNDTDASEASNKTIASLFRGVINLQSRYLISSPFCNAFQAPSESGIAPLDHGGGDRIEPSYSNTTVYECKYELDSLAAFLEVSTDYYTATNDLAFFTKYNWVAAVQTVLNTAQSMMIPTYAADGSVNTLPYIFQREVRSAEQTLYNNGDGNPVQNGTGLIRSAFRPSDDACIYEFLIPANMMFAHYLNTTSSILTATGNNANLANEMSALSASLTAAITEHGIVSNPVHGDIHAYKVDSYGGRSIKDDAKIPSLLSAPFIYAYEVDGYGGRNIMDDAKIPSLLSAPFIGFLSQNDSVYQATRALLLSGDNPYFMRGTVINAIGGPHVNPGYASPMASIMRVFTSEDDGEIAGELRQLVASTDGLGERLESSYFFLLLILFSPFFSFPSSCKHPFKRNLNHP